MVRVHTLGFALLALLSVVLVVLLETGLVHGAESNVFQRYYALMEKRKQLNDLSRNSALIAMQSENFDGLIESVTQQFNLIKSGLEKSGGENFKSCADINNQRLNIYGSSNIDDGVYLIFVSGKAVPVYCDMNSLGGGFTLVRRVSTPDTWWPLNDNFSGAGYGNYDGNLAFAPNVVFGLDYSTIPRSKVLFKTGDSMHWLMASEKYLREFTDEDSCNKSVPILASSKYGNVMRPANWCVRKVRPEDPWVSFDDHGSFNRNVYGDDELHSMLWGENSSNGWGYWKNNHNGVNVFIK